MDGFTRMERAVVDLTFTYNLWLPHDYEGVITDINVYRGGGKSGICLIFSNDVTSRYWQHHFQTNASQLWMITKCIWIIPKNHCFARSHFFHIFSLNHWGRVTHICVGNLAIIGSHNGLSPGRRQAIIWTSAGILLIGPLGTNFSDISIEFPLKKMRLKGSSAEWRPFVSVSMGFGGEAMGDGDKRICPKLLNMWCVNGKKYFCKC